MQATKPQGRCKSMDLNISFDTFIRDGLESWFKFTGLQHELTPRQNSFMLRS
jgi:hypothetical protein